MNKPPVREQGFTILETLTAIGVISLSTLLLLMVLYSSMVHSVRSRETLIGAAKVLRMDEGLRNHIASINIPYWERARESITSMEPGASLEIPWYEGDPERILQIRINSGFSPNSQLEIISPDTHEQIDLGDAIQLDSLHIITDQAGGPAGVEVRYDYRGLPRRMVAAFSSRPLPGLREGERP